MSKTAETIKQDIDRLTPDQLQQVADFIAFIKFQNRRHHLAIDTEKLASLANEFAAEDRDLAEQGMGDYAALLEQEDRL